MRKKRPPSTKSLFRAVKPKPDRGPGMFGDLPDQVKPEARDPLDYDPTPPDATQSFLVAEVDHIRAHGNLICEPAVGNGHMARVFRAWGFQVRAGDIEDRGYDEPFCLGSYYDTDQAPAPIMITNPPYGEVSARDGHGRWLRHALGLGHSYIGMLLNADWCAARINGFDEIFRDHPPSIEYLCCWKIDFRGKGSPPQRNSFFVWDVNRPPVGPNTWLRSRLYREREFQGEQAQGCLL